MQRELLGLGQLRGAAGRGGLVAGRTRARLCVLPVQRGPGLGRRHRPGARAAERQRLAGGAVVARGHRLGRIAGARGPAADRAAQQRRVVGPGVITGLDGHLLLARAAGQARAGLGSLGLGASGRAAAHEAVQLGQPGRYPVQRRAGGHQQAEPGDEGQQRRGHPRGDAADQRRRHRVADEAARGPDRVRAVHRPGRAVRDVQQAEPADEQSGPADHHAGVVRVPVRVPQVAPGEQPQQERHHPGRLAEPVAEHGGQAPAHDAAQMPPDGRGREDGQAEGGQADPIPAVRGVQVPGVPAEGADGRADRVRQGHPGPAEHADHPADQDHDRVGRRGWLAVAASARPAVGRRGPPAALPRDRLAARRGAALLARGIRRARPPGCPALAARSSLGRTSRHDLNGIGESGPERRPSAVCRAPSKTRRQ